jgi:hypothetical protein
MVYFAAKLASTQMPYQTNNAIAMVTTEDFCQMILILTLMTWIIHT